MANPLTADEEAVARARWVGSAVSTRAVGEEIWCDLPRLWSTLDAVRAELATRTGWLDNETAARIRQEQLRADLATERAKLATVGNLLARLNGDGGHRQDAVGVAQAAIEAEARVVEMVNDIARLTGERDEALESLPWATNRTGNDVDRALDPVYRHQLGGLGGIWPEIGVVEVTRAKSALQAAYADVNALRDRCTALEAALATEREVSRGLRRELAHVVTEHANEVVHRRGYQDERDKLRADLATERAELNAVRTELAVANNWMENHECP